MSLTTNFRPRVSEDAWRPPGSELASLIRHETAQSLRSQSSRGAPTPPPLCRPAFLPLHHPSRAPRSPAPGLLSSVLRPLSRRSQTQADPSSVLGHLCSVLRPLAPPTPPETLRSRRARYSAGT